MLKIITAIIDCSDTRRAELCFLTVLPSANKNAKSLFWKLFSSVLGYQERAAFHPSFSNYIFLAWELRFPLFPMKYWEQRIKFKIRNLFHNHPIAIHSQNFGLPRSMLQCRSLVTVNFRMNCLKIMHSVGMIVMSKIHWVMIWER